MHRVGSSATIYLLRRLRGGMLRDGMPPIRQRLTNAVLVTLLRESHPWLLHVSKNHLLLVGRKSSITALVHLVCPLTDAL